MLQRSVKPSKGSTLGQTTGGYFFSVLPLKLHSGRKGDVGVVVVGGGGVPDNELRKTDKSREGSQLQKLLNL